MSLVRKALHDLVWLCLIWFSFQSYKLQTNTTYCCQSILHNVAHSILNMMKWCWCDHWLHIIQAAFPWTPCWLLNATSSCSSIEVKNILSTCLSKHKTSYLLRTDNYLWCITFLIDLSLPHLIFNFIICVECPLWSVFLISVLKFLHLAELVTGNFTPLHIIY